MPQQIRRLLVAFTIFIALFLFFRFMMIPKSFGDFGHYRGQSLEDNAAKPLQYAGNTACIKCHKSVVEEKSRGHHAGLACESCHGPALKHAMHADTVPHAKLPDSLLLGKPTERKDCALCHNRNLARMKFRNDTVNISMIKQVDVMKHNLVDKSNETLKCIDCHFPHDPF